MKILYLISGAGHQAVMIFFILSGCVIAHVIQSMNDRDAWSWRAYFGARLIRLWVVLIPALVLTAAWDFLGISFESFAQPIYSGTGFGNVMNQPVSEASGVLDFLGNVLFLQTIAVPTFGSNGPLWSIAFEFVYYLAYPALAIALFSKTGIPYRFLLLLAAAALLYCCGWAILRSFPIWLAGAFSYWLYRKYPAAPSLALPGFIFFTITLLGGVLGSRISAQAGTIDWDHVIAACTAAVLYFGLSVKPSARLHFWAHPFRRLSAVSYSVYLLHMPLLVFISSRFFGADSSRWSPDAENILAATGLGVLVLAYCVLIWFFTERQTHVIRDWLLGFRRLRGSRT